VCDALHISDRWGYDAIRWHVPRRREVLLARLSLPALDEFDNVAIGIFHHGDGGPGADGGLGRVKAMCSASNRWITSSRLVTTKVR
jgi:hypothetical protein